MNSILIIRPSAIGDVVMASGMIPRLKERYPDARILWLADPSVAPLLESHPQIDAVLHWPKGQWRRLLRSGRWLALGREVWALRRRLRQERFDLAIDAVGLLRSRLLAALSGARERIGFLSKEPGAFLLTRAISRGERTELMSSEYRHLLRELGCDGDRYAPSLYLSDADEAAAAALVDEKALPPFAVLAPFTTRPQKHWFEKRWALLAEKLRNELGLTPVLLGAPSDRESAARIGSLCTVSICDLTGETTLAQTAALVRRCDLLVGVDTGLTHMGTAFSRPTVALFGATCPYLETPSSRTRILYDPLPCSPCRRRPSCDGVFTCMERHSVEDVMQCARQLLEGEAEA